MSKKVLGKDVRAAQRKARRLPKRYRKAPHTTDFDLDNAEYVPTPGDRAFVQKLSAYGMTIEQICSLIELKFNRATTGTQLRKHFRLELDCGTTELVLWNADRVVQHSKKGNLNASIFLLKTRGKWAAQVNVADPNGNPIQPPNVMVVFGAEDEQPKDLKQVIDKEGK